MSDVEVYRYYEPNGGPMREGWYIAFMDEMGFVCIQSDWGNYAYGWHSRGEGVGIREFLLQCDDSYLLGKFAPKRVYDEDATRESIREAMTEEEMGEEGYELEEEHFQCSDFSNEIGFTDWLRDTLLTDGHEYYCTKIDPQAVEFMKRVWPRLCAKMRADLDEKKAANDRLLAQLEGSARLGAR